MGDPTPGPWSNGYPHGRWDIYRGEAKICTLPHSKSDEQAANARLIAASPSLLKAAEELIQTVEIYKLNELRRRPYRELKRAVAKARGEE